MQPASPTESSRVPAEESQGRRAFLQTTGLKTAGAAVGVSLLPEMFTGLESRLARGEQVRKRGWGELRPAKDAATGLELLALPEGFRYLSFGWTKDSLTEGGTTPGMHDGMAVIASDGTNVTLCRNHEESLNKGPYFAKEKAYDESCSGGCTNLLFDTVAEKVVKTWGAISGTTRNCAGGPTPWGTWLTCEETVVGVQQIHDADAMKGQPLNKRNHGYIFEVGADGVTDPIPLAAMGRFVHEAVAVDPATGYVYEPRTAKRRASTGSCRRRRASWRTAARCSWRGWSGCPTRADASTPKTRTPWNGCESRNRTAHTPGGGRERRVLGRFGRVHPGQVAGRHDVRPAGRMLASRRKNLRELDQWRRSRGGASVGVRSGGGEDAADLRIAECQNARRAGQHHRQPPGRSRVVRGWRPEAAAAARTDTGRHAVPHRGRERRVEGGAERLQRRLPRFRVGGGVLQPDGKWLFANLQDPGFTVAITGPWEAGGL